MEIVTVRMKDKNLDCSLAKQDFFNTRKLIQPIRNKEDLNHLFLIHPESSNSIIELLKSLKNKSDWFMICLSTDLDALKEIEKNENIWIISYAIPTPADFEIKNKFNNFYKEISQINSAKNINEIQSLIIKYLDPTHELTPKIEQDIAYIYLWKSMSRENKDWTILPRFGNDNERIKKIEYFLRKLS